MAFLSTQAILDAAASRGERGMAILRLALLVPLTVQLAVEGLRHTRPWQALAVAGPIMVLGVVASVVIFVRVRNRPASLGLRMVSVTIDASVASFSLIASVLWPNPTWRGVLHHTDSAVLLLVVAAAGLRLSKRVAWTATGVNALLLAVLLTLDILNNPLQSQDRLTDCITAVLLLAAAAALAHVFARWAQQLVVRAAESAAAEERTRARMGSYLSDEIAAEVLEAKTARVGGQESNVAVLFSDLRGFTARGEQVTPEQLIGELNAYFDVMVRVVRAHGGVVDKYIGDALMVVFGAPRFMPDAALRAVQAALAMDAALVEHNLTRKARGIPPLAQGVGVHCGPVIAGNVGSRERLQYTVIGDTVNVASRIESWTKELKVSVLVSVAVMDRLPIDAPERQRLRPVGDIVLRGRQQAIALFGAGGTSSELGLPPHESGITQAMATDA